jgi:hypothetical protein
MSSYDACLTYHLNNHQLRTKTGRILYSCSIGSAAPICDDQCCDTVKVGGLGGGGGGYFHTRTIFTK